MAKKAAPTLNRQRLNNMMKHLLKAIRLFATQGHPNVCYNAQFFRNGKKQNPISKGEIESFSENVRSFITSEEADSVRIEFIDEDTGKTFYTKVLDELMTAGREEADEDGEQNVPTMRTGGLNGYSGLGEAHIREMNEIVGKRLGEERRNDEFDRIKGELAELRNKYGALESEKDGLEATLAARKDLEFYSGIIGAAFPGLAPLFTGTPLAQAAGFLAGTNDMQGNVLSPKATANEDASSISAMVSEFCNGLNAQEAGAMHLIFIAFESDRSKIQAALHYITTNTAS